jgi:cytochrome c oxidase cbb3-type subunit 4
MDIDINMLRSLTTVLGLACFVGIWAWAWSRRNEQAFKEAAQLPFKDEETLP